MNTLPFLKPDICTPCGGKCCKRQPGCAFPQDFGLPGDPIALLSALASGYFTIDWYEGLLTNKSNETEDGGFLLAYYVRPAYTGHEGELTHAGWGGRCSLLTPTGCSLSADERPTECRALQPVAGAGACHADEKFTKDAACEAWLPYNDLLKKLIEESGIEPAQAEPVSIFDLLGL